jgi:hypothetical protein
VPVRAFSDPTLFDELLGDHGDGAALQTRVTCEVGARDGLVRSDQIENDASIDIARSLAGSNLKIGQIDSSHGGFADSFYTIVPVDGDLIRGAN